METGFFEISIDIECSECGQTLECEYSEEMVSVKPCESCLENAEEVISERVKEPLDEKIEDLESIIQSLEKDLEESEANRDV